MLFTSCTNTYNQRLETLIKDIVNDTIIINKSFPGITFLIDSCHCIKLLSIPTQSQQSKEILLNFIKDYN